MAQVVQSKQARLDLISVWSYIAQDNPGAADKWLDDIEETCVLLSQHPRLGPARPDLAHDMRYMPMGSYLILYKESSDGVEIVRVLHGARNLDAIFHIEE